MICEHSLCDKEAVAGGTKCWNHSRHVDRRVRSELNALRRRQQDECPACGADMKKYECVFCGYPNDSAHDGMVALVELMGGGR